jgi:exodeoxyribonuclease V beta subunit
MSHALDPLTFPLQGARLIEASAGTGKTYTIAALYVRLVLGHGDGHAFGAALLPADILVMTFTRAATRELSDRIRARLVEAAACFRNSREPAADDVFLIRLLHDYGDATARRQAAHKLSMAAEAMDECAVFTIDAWCQRMLREHAFDSGCMFDEEMISSEDALRSDALRDYWREQVYALDREQVGMLRGVFKDFTRFEEKLRYLVSRAHLIDDCPKHPALRELLDWHRADCNKVLGPLKAAWRVHAASMRDWLISVLENSPDVFDKRRISAASVEQWMAGLGTWAATPGMISVPGLKKEVWNKLSRNGILECVLKAHKTRMAPTVPDVFDLTAPLRDALESLQPLEGLLLRHAAVHVARRVDELKQQQRQFGFADMLTRLRKALDEDSAGVLRQRIVTQYPVAMVDEFQDTSPDQYRILNALYRVDQGGADGNALFMIGDPKQAIYSFRGADIRSYLAARAATAGRHYRLDTNFRSTNALVAAVNHVFGHAESLCGGTGHPAGAFRFRSGEDNPLPFDPVRPNGRREVLVSAAGDVAPMTIRVCPIHMNADPYKNHFAGLCAERIVALLNDPQCGFAKRTGDDGFTRLQPADIAVLVRDRHEAAAVRRALQKRGVRSVYLSDKDSVFRSVAAGDVLRWLQAIASPLDGSLGRAAFATATARIPLEQLAAAATDDMAWEARVESLKALRQLWQRHGVLPMLRRFIHDLRLPAALLRQHGGERQLTDLLHLAELLQAASLKVDGEQALIRWLADQIADDGEAGDERVQRLESDAELVQVVTVHKSKGLQYPLVFVPFAVSAKSTERGKPYYEYADESGRRIVAIKGGDDAVAAVNAAMREEDLRLLYVALTRAEHAVWLGVTSLSKTSVSQSALNYLVHGDVKSMPADLLYDISRMAGACAGIVVEDGRREATLESLRRDDTRPPLRTVPEYQAQFERRWSISSYSALSSRLAGMRAPETPAQDKLLQEAEETPETAATARSGWHGLPRGALPGLFMHDQLEWLARDGFAIASGERFSELLLARCKAAGWERHHPQVTEWLNAILSTPLPPLGCALKDLHGAIPEMEFWVPAQELNVGALDRLCQDMLPRGAVRPALAAGQLHGMLHGFQDLVFEHDGRYWVLDYKASALGQDDAAYTDAALAASVARNRYDVQGALYMLALHRLLRSRLGARYDPCRDLGGTLFYFLRGVGNDGTRGCFHLQPDPAFLDELDRLLQADGVPEALP